MPKIELTTGISFEADGMVSILSAASQSDVYFPYGCRTGRCGSCKCKVLKGITSVLQGETSLSEQEKEDGWILSCQRSAKTDLLIQVDNVENIELPKPKRLPCRIHTIDKLSSDIIRVKLRIPPTADFQYVPGQYVDVIAKGGIRRSYSLASEKVIDNLLELHIRSVSGGVMSQYWFENAKGNDLLHLEGPLGTFFLHDIHNQDVYLIATGTGIAPIKAMIEYISQLESGKKPNAVTIIWGGRFSQDHYFDIDNLACECTYIPVLSQPEKDWVGAVGYVQTVLLDLKPDMKKSVVYACGSENMIASAKNCLINAGLPVRKFYSDAFVCSGLA